MWVFFFGEKLHVFLMFLAIRGEDLDFFSEPKAENKARRAKMDVKITLFDKLVSVFGQFWGSKKVLFWTFPKLLEKVT